MNRFALAFLFSSTCFYLSPILPNPAFFFPILVLMTWCVKHSYYIVAGLFSGVSLICFHGFLFQLERLPVELYGVDIEVIGRVTGIPRKNGSKVQFNFELKELVSDTSFASTPKILRLSCYQCELKLRAGELWLLTVRLKPGRGMLNPGGFDYEKWLRAKGVDAVGYIRAKSENRLLDASSDIVGIRGRLAEQLNALPLSQGAQALTRALALGDGSTLGKPFWEVLRKTGTSHLMVISGLHITLIAASISWLFSLFWRPLTTWGGLRISRFRFSFAAGVVAALLYAGLAGFTVPTVRALIMLLGYMVFKWSRRHIGSMKPLAISLIVVLLVQPYSPLLPGFWLSFFAVAFIHFYLTTRINQQQWLLTYVHWHFALTIGMAPITIFFFGYFSPLAMIANFFAVPLVSILIVPLVLIGAIALFVLQPLGIMILETANRIMAALLEALTLLANAEFSQLWLGGSTIVLCLLFLLGIVVWLVPVGIRISWLALPLASAIFLTDLNRVGFGEFDVKIVDVGQGLSVLVSTQNHHLLFDTGGYVGGKATVADVVVLPLLRYEGVHKLDKMVISHSDSDHSAGIQSVSRGLTVEEVVAESTFAEEILANHYCGKGDSWEWDGVHFEFINDPDISYTSENNRSCVLLVSSGNSLVMLPGDIEKEAERHLVSTSDKRSVDLILAPHHGSRTSSGAALIRHFDPKYVVYSVAWKNRYGFPHADVVERYNQAGVQAYRTDRDGMLTFRFDKDGIRGEPIAYRNTHREFWRSDFDLRLQ